MLSTNFVLALEDYEVTRPPSSLQSFLNSLPEVPEWALYVVSFVCCLILFTLIVILLCHCCKAPSASPRSSPSNPSVKRTDPSRSESASDRRLLPCCEQVDGEQPGGHLNSTQQSANYANVAEYITCVL